MKSVPISEGDEAIGSIELVLKGQLGRHRHLEGDAIALEIDAAQARQPSTRRVGVGELLVRKFLDLDAKSRPRRLHAARSAYQQLLIHQQSSRQASRSRTSSPRSSQHRNSTSGWCSRLSGVYFQGYRVALEMAMAAELAFEYELNTTIASSPSLLGRTS